MSASTNGLDIQKNYISIAQFAPEDNAVLQVAIQPLTDEDDEEIGFWGTVAQELKNLKKLFRFNSSNVVCSLSSEQAVIKAIQVENDEEDQQQILNWEFAHHLAGSMDEYACDFQEMASGMQMEYRHYLAAAVRQEAVARLRKTIKSVKLNPFIIDLDLFALVNVFEANYPDRISDASVLVHAENECTRVVLTNSGSFIDYGSFEFSEEAQDETAFCSLLQRETARLLSANTEFVPQGAVCTYLAGSLFANQQFASAVLGKMSQSELLNPFRKITCRVEVDAEQLKTYSSQLAVSVGLALRGDEAEEI